MSSSTHENSQYSLDEFEEIERLIQENTAPESEDEGKDTSAADSSSLKEPESHVQVDTGYQTSAAFDYAEESADPDTTTREDSRISDHESSTSSRSSLRRTTNLQFQSESSDGNDEEPTERSNTEQELTLIQSLATPRETGPENELGESDDNKLVATFGTTENFEALLQKQLEDMEENFSDNDIPQQNAAKQKTQPLRHSTPASTSAKISLPRQKKILNRTTRSPAANRARKASQKSRTSTARSHSPGLADSSDDLSVHSEASRHELRQRLRKARSEKKKEQSITQQLQHDYDDLLTRFAEAENVIDQLRIGAKIDLFASIPNGGGDPPDSGRLAASYPIDRAPSSHPHTPPPNSQRFSTSSSPRISQASRPPQDVDNLTENSLKFPAVASMEFHRIALEHQANELREHMESFRALLDEADVPDPDKRQVLGEISKSLEKLEADYITTGKDHDAEKRAMILSGNANGSTIEDFDPDGKIEGEIYRLRKMLDDLREDVVLGPSLPQTPASSRRFQNSEIGSESNGSGESDQDLDAGFNEQLRRYNKMPLESDREDRTTASSRNLSSDDDDTTIEFPTNATPRKSSAPYSSSGMPERFLRPPSSSSTSPTKSVQQSPEGRGGISPSRNFQNKPSPNKTNSSFQLSDESPDSRHRPKSRLPRPVGPRSQSTGVIPPKNAGSHDMDRDSGFVGSESSRQSYPLKYEPVLQRLSPVHSSPHSQRPVPVQRKPSRQEIKQPKTTTKPDKSTKSPKTSTGTNTSRHSDREKVPCKAQAPVHDASSFTPPKQVFRQKPSMSEDGSSTWSTPLKPRPAISQQTFAREPSGSPVFATTPIRGHRFQQTPSGTSADRYRPSSRRSGASSSKDSTLDLLRGEIAKLRQEIMENRALAEKPLKDKFDAPSHRTYTSESQATESASKRGRRSTRTKDRRRGSKQDSHASGNSTAVSETKPAKRDAKTGDDTPITTEQLSPVTDLSPPNDMTIPKGHWEYVSPYFTPSAAATVQHIPAVYSPPAHPTVVPIQADSAYYSPVKYTSPARIYLPVSPSVPVVCNSIPVETRMYRRRGSGYFIQAATQTSDRASENDRPLTRSQLKSPKRSSSVPPLRQSYLDPQLSISLRRAERAANSLRQKSRSMYKSLRDSYNRSELASTFA